MTERLIHCNRRYQRVLEGGPAVPLWVSARRACESAVLDGAARQEVQLVTAQGIGRTFEVDVVVFQRDSKGRATQLLIVGSDVTDQRQLELQLRQSRRLESLGRLAGGVAHDFNNMLTVILASADFLEPALRKDRAALADLEALRRAADEAQGLTAQLLAFARPDAGKVEPLAVGAAVTGSLLMLKRSLGEDLQVELSLEASCDTVRMDRGQLEQVIVNLAVNARDAMSQGGTLRIVTRNVNSDGGQAEPIGLHRAGYLELSVQDTGTGMPADIADRAFEPFFTTKGPGKGTGLGLSTVYGIVDRAGGHAAIDSEPGKGTTVRLWLPVHEGVQPVAQGNGPQAPVTRAGRRRRILLVEDDEAVCAVNARALRAGGHEVTAADGPTQALALVKGGQSFDLVVSDIVMPDMSGLELADRLQLLGSFEMLFVSGYAEEALLERGVRSADINLLRKPFTPDTLLKRVNAIHGEDASPSVQPPLVS